MPANKAAIAAKKIWHKYERYLGAPHMGNQDSEACIMTMTDIIEAEFNPIREGYCVICGVHWVDTENGEDTCEVCLIRN